MDPPRLVYIHRLDAMDEFVLCQRSTTSVQGSADGVVNATFLPTCKPMESSICRN